ncbi:uracil DNA glycosylase superfamily protein [Variibacter gotjawalensis]|uniref:Type-5 uracil-DNA glycosylase n=1 Tax=Variibacter gotjawalensis TaxID=1333996 RepID=A0A0S3PXW1_9BRAD|nr:uracil-DNA glycosylase [Variibacter gotjawalensis]NIK46568.1 uracil-DNA glycosylase family 4 [Variibacter gotjawalensis]RZS48472.1 uracil-DNA glycosylase family 4 [Variibacter gotjawalensis]BAT60734.1 uracil DNA glycosylase superfamily protein [Variibacter gotjawalensis]
MQDAAGPGPDCSRCPRLKDFRDHWREREPSWFNSPVPAFGPKSARLAVIGLAPGLRGANRTGRPFTGDYAGELLYSTLIKYGFARGKFEARPDDSLELLDCRIVNAVRCVPPGNKPTPLEIKTCRDFLTPEIEIMPNLKAIVTLGKIAHDSVVAALAAKPSRVKFGHAAEHDIDGIAMFDSYHCSRLNTNTGTLTTPMFHDVFAAVRKRLGQLK